MDLCPGKVVHLNSGSPPLTIVEVRADGIIELAWYSGGMYKTAFVPKECITDNK